MNPSRKWDFMKPWVSLILTSLLISSVSLAQDLNIVDVRRNITLSDEDVVYKDFYINGSEAEGLKKNLIVTAVRKIQIRDANGSQSYGDIQVPVGQLRVIATYGRISVAREYKLLSREELPMLEQTGLMNGDKIDLKGSFIDNNKPVHKKKTAEHPIPKETAAETTAVVTIVPSSLGIAVKGPAPASVPAPAPKTASKSQ